MLAATTLDANDVLVFVALVLFIIACVIYIVRR